MSKIVKYSRAFSCTASSCRDLEDARFWIGSKKLEMHVFGTFLHVSALFCTFFARFLVNEYLRYTFWWISTWDAHLCTFLHIFVHYCMLLYLRYTHTSYKVLTFNSTGFYSWTLYYIPLTLWYTILSCMSFSILQKTCITRPYCRGEGMPKILMGKYLCDWLYHLTEISSGRGCSRHKTTAKNFRLSEEHKSSLNSELFIMNLTNFE